MNYVRLLRPYQWIKNGFVFTGFLFVRGWEQPGLALQAAGAAAAFCLTAGAVYVLNDLRDRELDRQHPTKCLRPLAAGTVSPNSALLLMVAALAAGLTLGYRVSTLAALLLLCYLALNLLYSWRLKQVVILDVFVLASGYLLRILVGTTGLGIPPSEWLLLCGTMLALFIGFGKRQAELLSAGPGNSRSVLEQYSETLLNHMLTITASATLLSYALYTVDEATVEQHHTHALMYTVPIVAYGLFRFLYVVHQRELGEDLSLELFRDRHLLGAALAWFAAVALILRGSGA